MVNMLFLKQELNDLEENFNASLAKCRKIIADTEDAGANLLSIFSNVKVLLEEIKAHADKGELINIKECVNKIIKELGYEE